jgi:hypothetical protein
MKRAALLSALVVGLSLSSTAARADIPPPPRDLPEGKQPISLSVYYTPNKDITFIRIGRNALPGLVPQEDKKTGWAPSPTRSIAAATALSLGVAGLFLLRGKRGAQMACGMILAAGLGAFGAEVWGNAPAPDRAPPAPIDVRIETSGTPKPFHGRAVVEVVDGQDIQLLIGTRPTPVNERRDRGPPPPSPPSNPVPNGPDTNSPAKNPSRS